MSNKILEKINLPESILKNYIEFYQYGLLDNCTQEIEVSTKETLNEIKVNLAFRDIDRKRTLKINYVQDTKNKDNIAVLKVSEEFLEDGFSVTKIYESI